ncbi:MAG: YbjN domain-containing protein [Deltaproteobacteria bacterium]|nr:YbjN domain-containing protein [Deltaproteobacteria bacterium]
MPRDDRPPSLEDFLPSTLARAASETMELREFAMEALRGWAGQCRVEAAEFEPYTAHIVIPLEERPLNGVVHVTDSPVQLVVYVLYDPPITEALRPAYEDFILRANYDLPIGNFEMDPEGGPLRLRSGLVLEGLELTPRLFAAVIEPTLRMFASYLPALDEVYCGTPPAKAIAAVRVRAE